MLEQLHGHLATQQTAAVLPREALSGLGGVGKTELSVEFAHRFASDYDITWWIPAEQAVTTGTALTMLATELGIATGADQNETVSAVLKFLRGRDRWLLIYDNAEHPEQLAEFLPTGGGGHVLITSRWPAWRQHAEELKVGVLDRSESIAFLTRRIGRIEQGELLNELADLVGDLPLALDEAAAYLEQTGAGVHGYLKLLRARFADLFDLAGVNTAGRDQRRVATVWSVSLDRVHTGTPVVQTLLNLLAFMATEVPRTLLTILPEVLPFELAALASDPISYNQALRTIGGYSLATVTPKGIGLQRLVQTVIQAQLTVEEQRFWAETAVALIRALIPVDSGEVKSWPLCETLLPQVIAATAHAERLQVALVPTSQLLDRTATYLQGRGQYRPALSMLTRAVAAAEAALGPDHPDLGIRRSNLGGVLRALGDLGGARSQYQQALNITEAALGPDRPTTKAIRASLNSLR